MRLSGFHIQRDAMTDIDRRELLAMAPAAAVAYKLEDVDELEEVYGRRHAKTSGRSGNVSFLRWACSV